VSRTLFPIAHLLFAYGPIGLSAMTVPDSRQTRFRNEASFSEPIFSLEEACFIEETFFLIKERRLKLA
jgi:hypothetical protein